MKKQLLFSLSIFFSSILFAQVNPTFGIRAGVSSAGMRGDAVSSFKNVIDFTNGLITTADRTGFFAGAVANIPVAETFSVEPALYYTQKGYVLNGAFSMKGMSFLGANAKAQLRSQYIDLPVVIKAGFKGFQVFAGPQISYLVKADLRTTGGAFGINLLNATTETTQQFNRWDAALTAGIGYRFTNGFNVVASYDYGISKVDANQSMKSYNRTFKLGIGMQL